MLLKALWCYFDKQKYRFIYNCFFDTIRSLGCPQSYLLFVDTAAAISFIIKKYKFC